MKDQKPTIWTRFRNFVKSDYFFTIMMVILGILTILYAIIATL